jgi:hypothetical protein
LKRFNANQLRLAVLASQNLEQVFAGRQTPAYPNRQLPVPVSVPVGRWYLVRSPSKWLPVSVQTLPSRAFERFVTFFTGHRFSVFHMLAVKRREIVEDRILLLTLLLSATLRRPVEASLD